ncbi:DUF6252 family protein [Aquimarina sp. MMG016]|uniref:DUF6252 family protein n=1 Tax=Aquimarina sp. MMG016 TaxID=2822690 RepID=UPI001B3A3A67|nr:DUF6252 family protein [Aquimarina sp. MMG016]MBQ4820883.1 hypothetical protein [Aquimarina sp. MMG016]
MNRKTTLLFLCIPFAIISCIKDTDVNLAQTFKVQKFTKHSAYNTSEIINPCLLDASLTAIINDSKMITDDHTATVDAKNQIITLKANNETKSTTLKFPINTSPGVYKLSKKGKYSASYQTNNKTYSSLSGKLIIKDYNIYTKCIAGNFEFKTINDIAVSEGFFEFGY